MPNAQLRSKDLLSNARERFLRLDRAEKAAECENHLALTFWRTGEFNEAEDWINEALAHNLPHAIDARLSSYVTKGLIDLSCKRYEAVIETGTELESDFRKHFDPYVTGSFYTNFGLGYKNLGDLPKALGCFDLARYYHQRSRHKIYLGTVENNLAQLYKETGKFTKAHESIDNATRIFKKLKDGTREGYSLDTKALVYFAESRYGEALRTVDKALAILRKSENSAYLIDTLLTRSKILLFLDNFSDAVFSLVDAINIARVQTGERSAERLIEEFRSALDARNSPPKKDLENGDLELVLPQSIAHFSDYRGIWINNTRLEDIGLTKGSLAIFVKDKINRGDLIALAELENEHVSCGFYDAEFGIVCIEGTGGEPQIFDEKDVRILGKIVGVCTSGRREDGTMVVEAIKL